MLAETKKEKANSVGERGTSLFNLFILKSHEGNRWEHYPTSVEVTGLKDLQKILEKGFVGARFVDGIYSDDNFIDSDVLVLVCNNREIDPMHQVRVEDFQKTFSGIPFYYYYCTPGKNENQPFLKSFVVLLPLKDKITDIFGYIAQRKTFSSKFYYFDDNLGVEVSYFQSCSGEVPICPPVKDPVCGYVDENGNIEEIGRDGAFCAAGAENHTQVVESSSLESKHIESPSRESKRVESPSRESAKAKTITIDKSSASSDDDVILDALDYINPDCDYPDWVRVGMALEAEGYDCDTWENWSARGGKYTPGQCAKLWRGFHAREGGVAGGTIVKMAEDAGFVPRRREIKIVSHKRKTPSEQPRGAQALKAYLLALHDEEDEVQILTDAAFSGEKWRPNGKGDVYQVNTLVERLDSGDVENALRCSVNNKAGAWVRINPVKNADGRDDSVAKFKYVLVESDELPKDEQIALYTKLDLPVAALVDSGGKSVHAIVHVDAENLAEYHFRVGKLYELLEAAGLKPDKADKNPSRLSRLPGVKRGDSEQALLGTNLGAESWDSWVASIKQTEEPKTSAFEYKPRAFGHDDEAEVLKQAFGRTLCYTAAGGWLTYDGKKWCGSEDKLNSVAIQKVSQLRSAQLGEAEKAVQELARAAQNAGIDVTHPRKLTENQTELYLRYKDAKKYYDFVVGCGSGSADVHILRRAGGKMGRDFSEFDSCSYLLNTPAGTVDLRTGKKHENQPEDLVTQITSVAPGEIGKEKWQQALNQWFQNDEELIKYVQRVCGLASFGAVRSEALYIAYGSGKNGKTTFWNVVSHVLGSYSTAFDTDTLVNQNANNTVEIAALKGKRLAISEEMTEGKKFNSKMLKTIASRAELHATPKYKAPMNFKPTHTPVLCTNFLPDLNARDYATLRRISIIPFNARFESTGVNRDDCSFQERIINEAGGAILQWIIDGAVEVHKLNYQIPLPAVVKKALDEYKRENDWLGRFLDECCYISPLFDAGEEPTPEELIDQNGNFTVKSSLLYNEYSLWAKKNNEAAYNNKVFKVELQRNGFPWRHTRDGSFFYGVSLKI